MISSEPEPDRTPRPALRQSTLQRPVVTITWTSAARREYSRLTELHSQPLPTRAQLNALTKKAIRQTLQHAPLKIASISELEKPTFAVDVSIVSDAEILELNSSHRGKNKPTDVLSWSQLEGEAMPFGEGALLGDEEILLGDLPGGRIEARSETRNGVSGGARSTPLVRLRSRYRFAAARDVQIAG